MPLTGTRTFVGFGFGAIQSGLFLYEAYQSGAFGRMVVAEVVPEMVEALRAAGGTFGINIAHADRIERAQIGPVLLENPAVPADRDRLIAAVAEADEIGTAVPSVAYYASDAPGSLHRVLAEGLRRKAAQGGPRCVVYTAENNNHAAELLQAQVMEAVPADEREAVGAQVRFLNTVIGKMSGQVGSAEIADYELMTLTPGSQRAFLVEAFNRILISPIDFPEPFARGIAAFEEKPDLLPFEEAKLYGHNATHALLAYLAMQRGLPLIADVRRAAGVLEFAEAAFIEESGAALIARYDGLDLLFTRRGYRSYVDDLMTRMTNPYLRDTAERVGRDPARKLGWDDRLIGVMRLALAHDIRPARYALGAAAAIAALERAEASGELVGQALRDRLLTLWGDAAPDTPEREKVLRLVGAARVHLRSWVRAGYPALERWHSAETP